MMGPTMRCCHLVATRSNAGYRAESRAGGKKGRVDIREKEGDRKTRERKGGKRGAEKDRQGESETGGKEKKQDGGGGGDMLKPGPSHTQLRAQAGQNSNPRTFVCSLREAPRGHRDTHPPPPPAHGSEPGGLKAVRPRSSSSDQVFWGPLAFRPNLVSLHLVDPDTRDGTERSP